VAAGRFAALRRAGSFLALLASEIGAVGLLGRLGQVSALRIPWHHLGPWLLNSPLQDVIGATLRMIALVAAWWLLSSNVLYLLASISRIPGAVLAVRWCTLPVVRRVTDHAVALTLATSIMSAGAAAAIANATPASAATLPRRPGPVAASTASPYAPKPAGPPGASLTPSPSPRPGTGPGTALGPGKPPAADPAAASPPGAQAQSVGGYLPHPAGNPSGVTPAAPTTLPPPTYVPHPAGPPTAAPPRRHGTSSSSSTTSSTTPPPVTTPSATASSPTTTTTPPTTAPPTTSPPSTTPPTTQPPAPVPSPSPAPSRTSTGQHEVTTGENLWSISRDRLAAVTGRHPGDLSDHEIATYWLRVIEANQSHLRSHDPNLIFPGEIIHLPAVGG